MTGFFMGHISPIERPRGGDRVAGPQHLGCRTGVFLQRVFAESLLALLALLAALLRVL